MARRSDNTFNGSIDDISVVDLMEILHYTHKSGVMLMRRGHDQAEIFFSQGNVVAASSTTVPQFISDHLVQAGAVDRATVRRALQIQADAPQRRPIGSILLEMGVVEQRQLEEALSSLISQIVSDAVAWDHGSVEFRLESTAEYRNLAAGRDLWSLDVPIDTRELIKDGLKLYNERNHRSAGRRRTCEEEDSDEVSRRLDQALGPHAGGSHPGVAFFSADPDLRAAFRTSAKSNGWVAYLHADAAEWASHLESCGPASDALSVAVLDLSRPGGSPEAAQSLELALAAARSAPRPVRILVFDPEELAGQARALAAGFERILVRPHSLPPDARAEGALMEGFLEVLCTCVKVAIEGPGAGQDGDQAEKKDAVTGSWILEFIRNRSSSSVSLSLLRFMAENAERSVLFLNRGKDLLAIGAFGSTPSGDTISSRLPHLTLPCIDTPIEAVVGGAGLFYGEPGDGPMSRGLFEIIGRPANPRVLLLPVTILDKVALVAYCDNGLKQQSFEGCIGSLEAISRYAGLVLENSLLRKKVKDRQLSR